MATPLRIPCPAGGQDPNRTYTLNVPPAFWPSSRRYLLLNLFRFSPPTMSGMGATLLHHDPDNPSATVPAMLRLIRNVEDFYSQPRLVELIDDPTDYIPFHPWLADVAAMAQVNSCPCRRSMFLAARWPRQAKAGPEASCLSSGYPGPEASCVSPEHGSAS